MQRTQCNFYDGLCSLPVCVCDTPFLTHIVMPTTEVSRAQHERKSILGLVFTKKDQDHINFEKKVSIDPVDKICIHKAPNWPFYLKYWYVFCNSHRNLRYSRYANKAPAASLTLLWRLCDVTHLYPHLNGIAMSTIYLKYREVRSQSTLTRA